MPRTLSSVQYLKYILQGVWTIHFAVQCQFCGVPIHFAVQCAACSVQCTWSGLAKVAAYIMWLPSSAPFLILHFPSSYHQSCADILPHFASVHLLIPLHLFLFCFFICICPISCICSIILHDISKLHSLSL